MLSVGHHMTLLPKIQKIVMASNFRDIFGSHICGTSGNKKFFKKNFFFWQKQHITKNEENLSRPVYKSSNFAWFLQAVALNKNHSFKMIEIYVKLT